MKDSEFENVVSLKPEDPCEEYQEGEAPSPQKGVNYLEAYIVDSHEVEGRYKSDEISSLNYQQTVDYVGSFLHS